MVSPSSVPPFVGTRHHDDRDLAFDCPSDWLDRSLIVYSAPRDPTNPTPPNVIARRDPAGESVTLRVHALREITLLAKKLPGFDLLETEDTHVSDMPAAFYRFGWQSPLGPLEQTITIVERGTGGQRTFTTFLTTARKTDAASARALFQAILQSVRFEAPRPPPSRPSTSEPRAVAAPAFVPMPRFLRT
jgi:hypothetical protein